MNNLFTRCHKFANGRGETGAKEVQNRLPGYCVNAGTGKKADHCRGWLHDISDKGARFIVEHQPHSGHQISLEVHFMNPDGEVTNIWYPAIVQRVSPGPRPDSQAQKVWNWPGSALAR